MTKQTSIRPIFALLSLLTIAFVMSTSATPVAAQEDASESPQQPPAHELEIIEVTQIEVDPFDDVDLEATFGFESTTDQEQADHKEPDERFPDMVDPADYDDAARVVPGGPSHRPETMTEEAEDASADTEHGIDAEWSNAFYGEIYPADDIDEWSFHADGGEQIAIAATRTRGDLDTVIALYAPNGRRIAFNDDCGASRNSCLATTLPARGRYTILVGSYQARSVGQYRLAISLEEPVAPTVFVSEAYTTDSRNNPIRSAGRYATIKLVAKVYNDSRYSQVAYFEYGVPSTILCDPIPCTRRLYSGFVEVRPGTTNVALTVKARDLSASPGAARWQVNVSHDGMTTWQDTTVSIR